MIRDLIGSVVCALRGSHDYKRARKHQDAAFKFCCRCGDKLAIRRRAPRGEAADGADDTRMQTYYDEVKP